MPKSANDPGITIVIPIILQHDAAGTVILGGQTNASNILCISKARLFDFICSPDASDRMVLQYNSLMDESIAQIIYSSLKENLNMDDSALNLMSETLKLSKAKDPVIIVDFPFMSDGSDQNKALVEEYALEIAEALHTGIAAAINESEFN